MLVSTNVFTPFSYAQVETSEVIPENGVDMVDESLWETEEIPEISEETPEVNSEEKWEIEQENQDYVAPENVLPNVQDDEETSATDETENVNTESEEVAQSWEETPENEIQDEEGKFEELERVKESVVMDIIPGTIVTLLPWTGFNSVIKTLANWWAEVPYTWVDNNIQSFQRVTEIPEWVITWEISIAWSDYPVYARFTWWILYYTTKAEIIQLNENSQQMFYNYSELIALDLSNFDTSNVTNINGIFAGCSKLEEINLSWWDFSQYNTSSLMMNMTYWSPLSLKYLNMKNTKYWTSMNYTFGWLTNLEDILLDWADTSQVIDMSAVFYWDYSLTWLDLSSFNTSKVTSMQSMFYQCSGLQNLNLDNWIINGSSSTIGSMFWWANKLKTLSMRNWTIPETFTNAIWWRTSSLSATWIETIDVSNWNLKETKDLHWLFASLNAKEIIWLNTRDTSNITDMGEMFQFCKLTGLDIKSWDVSNVTNMSSMFHTCSNLKELDLEWRNTSNVRNMNLILFNCWNLEWNLSWWDFRNVGSLAYSFNWKYLNLTNAKFSWSLDYAFVQSSFEKIIFDWVDTSNVTTMRSMFNLCSVTELDLSSFDTSNVIDMSSVFINTHLKKLNLSWWNFKNIRFSIWNLGMYSMYSQLEELNLTNAIFSWSMNGAFHAISISPIDRIILDWVDTSRVTDMGGMFSDQTKLTWLNLSSFDTSNVTNMSQMFYYCSNLEELNLSSFDTSNVANMSQMFSNCNSLTGLDLGNFNTNKVSNMYGIFGSCNNLEEINLSWRDFRNASPNMMNMTYWWNSSINKLNVTNAKYWTNMNQAFAWLRNLEEIKWLDTVDTSNVVDMSQMFNWCNKLGQLDLSNFNTTNVRNMTQMFFNCSGMQKLDLSSFDTSNVNNMIAMFYNTPNLKTIYASDKFVTTALNEDNSSNDMFNGTKSIIWWNWTKFDQNYIDEEYAKIDKVWQTWYFTDKNAINVKFINTLDWTETTSTFAKWQKLTPPSVDKYHVAWWYLDEAMTQEIDLNKWVDNYSEIYVKYDHNGSSGWWGGGWGWSTKPDTPKDEQQPAEPSQSDASSWTNVKEPESNTGSNIQTWSQVDSSEQTTQNDDSNTQDSSTSSQDDGKTYSTEFQEAYEFAKWNGITTMPTIQKANMEWKLTRIAMAKMLSQYAINVLWKEPDTSKTVKFKDVTSKKDADYDNWVTLAYQLWIMWQNMKNNKFRPDDEVTRAEFATALSRMAYWTSDWEYKSTSKYYIHHMEKLVNEWIITKDDPKMKELRWYVMIMLMRSAK